MLTVLTPLKLAEREPAKKPAAPTTINATTASAHAAFGIEYHDLVFPSLSADQDSKSCSVGTG